MSDNLLTLNAIMRLCTRPMLNAARGLLVSAASMLAVGQALAQPPAYQSHASIRATPEDFMRAQASVHDGKVEVEAGRLDSRLRLSACDAPLEASLPPGGRILGNTTVGVRCTGTRPWTLYVQVKVKVYATVVVTARPLTRGTLLSESDLALAERELSAMPYGHLSGKGQAVGQELKRALAAGAPLAANLIEAPQLVSRGQRVTLLAKSGSVEVRIAGKALMNGAAGERIRVQNLNSRRVIEGVITPAGEVQVNF